MKIMYTYIKLCKKSKWEYCCDLVAVMRKEFGEDPKIFIEDDEPYRISTIQNNCSHYYNIKVS